MAAVLYYPWWDITIAHRFERTDFIPKPKVDCVLLRIQARLKSLVNNKNAYQDFVAYKFIHERNAKYILPLQWIKSFDLKGSSVFRGNLVSCCKSKAGFLRSIGPGPIKIGEVLNKAFHLKGGNHIPINFLKISWVARMSESGW